MRLTRPLAYRSLRVLGLVSLVCVTHACGSDLGPGSRELSDASPALEALFVAVASDSADGTAPLELKVGTPSGATGVLLCEHDRIDECKQGKGVFLTSDFEREASGRRVFKLNVPVAPRDGQSLVVVAHDDAGALVGATHVKVARR
jgi:hypothetical protein